LLTWQLRRADLERRRSGRGAEAPPQNISHWRQPWRQRGPPRAPVWRPGRTRCVDLRLRWPDDAPPVPGRARSGDSGRDSNAASHGAYPTRCGYHRWRARGPATRSCPVRI